MGTSSDNGKSGIQDTTGKRKLVVVLGMHRSGTSVITRGLQALGIRLGDRLMPPIQQYNAKGFFEDLDLYELNHALLTILGSRWDALPLIDPAEFAKHSEIEEMKSHAAAILRARLEQAGGVFAFKDPRTPRLMPFWKEVFQRVDVDVEYVIAVRHPASVAESMKATGLAPEKAVYLWLIHVTAAFLESGNHKRVVVDYDKVISDPASQLQRIAAALGVPFDAAAQGSRDFAGEFLDQQLRHSYYDVEERLDTNLLPGDAIRIHRLLARMARDEISVDDPAAREVFLAVDENLRAMNPGFLYMERLDRKVVRLKEKLTATREVLHVKTNTIDELLGTIRSAEEWQDSWIQRAFHRWHPPGLKNREQSFFSRLQRSVTKRLPFL